MFAKEPIQCPKVRDVCVAPRKFGRRMGRPPCMLQAMQHAERLCDQTGADQQRSQPLPPSDSAHALKPVHAIFFPYFRPSGLRRHPQEMVVHPPIPRMRARGQTQRSLKTSVGEPSRSPFFWHFSKAFSPGPAQLG
ncbi:MULTISPECIES: hypothetical protein [Delftia]|uniref:hypothetical protein n=1 Tax=Delftia TaxID=80865 RepID=UPI00115FDB5E|nr:MULTISPECIES: hypothetical protein [Delftia]